MARNVFVTSEDGRHSSEEEYNSAVSILMACGYSWKQAEKTAALLQKKVGGTRD